MTIRLFTGWDDRESIGHAVFAHSVTRRASAPVAITPLSSLGMRQGTNAFTTSRFLIPWLCRYQGWAIFMDGADMLCLGDIVDLWDERDPDYAVQCVQHPDYKTRNPVKYLGTNMEAQNRDYPRKNWASAMVINCAHPDWRPIDPKAVREMPIGDLLELRFTQAIGEIPAEWNRLVDEGHGFGTILHWSSGIPAFPEYRDAPYADLWRRELANMEGGWTPSLS